MTQTPPTIEAVATAIMQEFARQDDRDEPAAFVDGTLKWNWIDQGEVDFGKVARAAIEAMKTPDDAMHFAGREAISRRLSDHSSAWQAMIQAALGEAG